MRLLHPGVKEIDLWRALGVLPEEQREVLVLEYPVASPGD
jgi:hypothetical protein